MSFRTRQATPDETKRDFKHLVISGRFAATCTGTVAPRGMQGNAQYSDQQNGVVKVGFKFVPDGYEDEVTGWCRVPFNTDAFNVREWLGNDNSREMPPDLLEQYSQPLKPPMGKSKGHKLYTWGRALNCFYKDAKTPDYDLFDLSRAVNSRVWITCSKNNDATNTNVDLIEVDAEILNMPRPARTAKPAPTSGPMVASGVDEVKVKYFNDLAKLADDRKIPNLSRAEIGTKVRGKFEVNAQGKPAVNGKPVDKPVYRNLPDAAQNEILFWLAFELFNVLPEGELPMPPDLSRDWVQGLPGNVPEAQVAAESDDEV